MLQSKTLEVGLDVFLEILRWSDLQVGIFATWHMPYWYRRPRYPFWSSRSDSKDSWDQANFFDKHVWIYCHEFLVVNFRSSMTIPFNRLVGNAWYGTEQCSWLIWDRELRLSNSRASSLYMGLCKQSNVRTHVRRLIRRDGGVAAKILSATFYCLADETPENNRRAFFAKTETLFSNIFKS